MTLLSIDPGPQICGWILTEEIWGSPAKNALPIILDFGLAESKELIRRLGHWEEIDQVAIEMIASYGMAVGASVFETCLVIGQLLHAHGGADRFDCHLVYRQDVKITLCKDTRAKDKNIRRAILDLYPATGGGKTPQVGTMKQPGPLFGIRSHIWSALAVALTVGAD